MIVHGPFECDICECTFFNQSARLNCSFSDDTECVLDKNVKHEVKIFKTVIREYRYNVIEAILKNDTALNTAWCEQCGIAADDDSRIYGWPESFRSFYSGWVAARQDAAPIDPNGI